MAAVTAARKKLLAAMILPIGGMALKRCAVRSTCYLAASPPYPSSMVPSMPLTSQLHPQIHPFLPFGGSLELMAVPKKKVTPHKKGLRNGPKALKPVPVIVRCKSCGRVKLPHFYCCSGDRGNSGRSEQPK